MMNYIKFSHPFRFFFYFSTILIALGIGFLPFFHTSLQSATCPTLVPGDLYKVPGVSTVYILNEESKSVYYPNSPVFQSWHDPNTAVIHQIDPSCADLYPTPTRPPYGVNYRPGTLMKNPSSARVYAISRGGVLHPIPSEGVARSVYGLNWARLVKDVSQVFWQNYRISTSSVQMGVPPEGMLASRGENEVYEFRNNAWARVAGTIPLFARSTVVPMDTILFSNFQVGTQSVAADTLGANVARTGEEDLNDLQEWNDLYIALNQSNSGSTSSTTSSPTSTSSNTASSSTPSTGTPSSTQPTVRSGGSGGGSGGGGSPPPPPPSTAPDITLDSSVSTSTIALGGIINITYSYQNAGDADASGVVITATVPTGTTFRAASSSSWSCSDGAAAGTACAHTVSSLSLGVTGTAAFVLNTLSASVGTVIVSASVVATETESNSSNNAETTTVTVIATNLSVTATSTYSRVMPGGTIVYTLSYRNFGTAAATGTTITVPVPTSTTFRSASSTGTWSCADGSVGGTSCVATIGALAVGSATSSINFAVRSVNAFVGTATATVTIADAGTNGSDSNTSNNAVAHPVRVAFLSDSDNYITSLASDLDQFSDTSSSTYASLGSYKMMPGTGTTFIVLNGVLGFPSGATDPTISHPTPLPASTSTPLRYAHTQLVSGDGSSEPAGIFGEVNGRLFSATNGFYARSRVSRATNNFGARGTILMMGTNFGSPGFEPSFLENGIGYGFNSTFATSTGYHFFLRSGTYDTGDPSIGLTDVALGSTAPRDDRMYEATIIVEAGATTGTARLLDLSDPDNPVVADSRTFTVPSSTGVFFPEVNASPGPAASGQTPQTFRIYTINGTQYLPNN